MARMTKKQIATLNRAIAHLNRARDYVFDKDLFVCRKDFNGQMVPMEKEFGSDLCGLGMALDELYRLYMDGAKET